MVGSDATSIRLRWKPVDQIDTYGLAARRPRRRDDRWAGPVNGSQNGMVVSGLPSDTTPASRCSPSAPGSGSGRPRRSAGGPPPHRPRQPERLADPGRERGQHPCAAVGPGRAARAPRPARPAAGPPAHAPPPAVRSTATGGPLAAGKWVLIASVVAQSSGAGRAAVDHVTEQLQAAGLRPRRPSTPGSTRRSSGPGWWPSDSWVALAGPYDTQAAAEADCAKVADGARHLVPRDAARAVMTASTAARPR